jgi:hypothetical protein
MNSRAVDALPETFRFSEALRYINERQFRLLLGEGQIIPLSRGLYHKADWIGDTDLIEISARSPRATLALRSALARHDLIDDIPDALDIAIPRGAWTPILSVPVRWHHFAEPTFDIGRDTLDIGAGRSIGIYSPARSIIDAIRLRHAEGEDMPVEALKTWLKQGGQPSELIRMARDFPHAERALRTTLSILL